MITLDKWESNFPPKNFMLPDSGIPRKKHSLSHYKWALCLLSGLSLAGCSHKLVPEGHYQNTPVVADGVPNEWSLPLRFSNANYTLQYNVTYDSKNLYVCVISRDDQTMLHMLRSGITLYFDPKGDKSKDIALHYPLRKQPDPASFRSRNGQPLTNSSDSAWKEELVHQSDDFGTAGFTGIENGQFAVGDQKCPIQVAIKLNNNDSMLVYEAIIPIYNVLGTDLSSRNPKKTFSVGVVVNPPEAPGAGSSRPYGGGGGGRGMGMGMRGFGGGGGGRRPSNNNQPVKEEANWYPFRLVGQ
jgi:hypothetical protein